MDGYAGRNFSERAGGRASNASGASTRDVITILQTIKAAGALHAELEVI